MLTISFRSSLRIKLECRSAALIGETVQKIVDVVRAHGSETNVVTVTWGGSGINGANPAGQFRRQSSTRFIEISNPTPQIANFLLLLDVPEGVELAVSL